MPFCMNCGQELSPAAKFCQECGAAVGEITANKGDARQQEYVGKLFKCPHCGGNVDPLDAICPLCGMRISGKGANGAVKAFKDQLMQIEGSRKDGIIARLLWNGQVDPADRMKLSLIRSFPVPNTMDEIFEFMMLAVANIDVDASRNSWANRRRKRDSTKESAASISVAISDAWVLKMEQMYHKAEASFPNDPVFDHVKEVYFAKMKELKRKID